MMSGIFARKALLPGGWADAVRLTVEDGRVKTLQAETAADPDDTVLGCVIPGICNAHSHAFQRALAGRTESRSPAGRDSFWTWRERMYELASRVDPDTVAAIARQAYSEMLESGYTAVVEFHYLHRPAAGATADDMFAALATAARDTGIHMIYVPVLYERAGFDAPAPLPHQARFAMDLDSFLAHHSTCMAEAHDSLTVGIGAHSLRAVSGESLAAVVAAAGEGPVHLHIAEQQDEVEQCVAATGMRPVEWLLAHVAVDDAWCLVHATHMKHDETAGLAKTGATVCLCPTTEANLGDGVFPLRDFLEHDGSIAIGSDSHISINPFEELRWLEYGQRLVTRSRNVAALTDPHVGRELFTRVYAGGNRAAGLPASGLTVGARADLVALDDTDPMLTGHADATLLDALVFSGYRLPVERVMVHGDWRVTDGEHVTRDDVRCEFATAIGRLGLGR